ncbi:hypothetical protein Tco_0315559 [Tanacetum coccineum]
MDYHFTNENDSWEYSLDIDDSDLHLTHVMRSSSSARVKPSPYTPNPVRIISSPAGTVQLSSSICFEPSSSTPNPVRIIPDPAGLVQQAKQLKENVIILDLDEAVMSTQEYMQKVVDNVSEDDDFNSGAWINATNYVISTGDTVTGCLEDINNFLKKGKLEQVVAIVKSCSSNALGDLNVTMKDLSVQVIKIEVPEMPGCSGDDSLGHKKEDKRGIGRGLRSGNFSLSIYLQASNYGCLLPRFTVINLVSIKKEIILPNICTYKWVSSSSLLFDKCFLTIGDQPVRPICSSRMMANTVAGNSLTSAQSCQNVKKSTPDTPANASLSKYSGIEDIVLRKRGRVGNASTCRDVCNLGAASDSMQQHICTGGFSPTVTKLGSNKDVVTKVRRGTGSSSANNTFYLPTRLVMTQPAARLYRLYKMKLPEEIVNFTFSLLLQTLKVYIEEEDTIGVFRVDCGILPHLWLLQDPTIKAKKVGLLNVEGYYNSLLPFIDKAVDEGFIPHCSHLLVLSEHVTFGAYARFVWEINGDEENDEKAALIESIEDEEVSLVDGVLEGALGALGDDS